MGWELTWARMWPSLQPTLSLQILLKTSAGTEKWAVLSRGTQYKWCDDWSTSSATCCPSWPHCPQTSNVSPKGTTLSQFYCKFFWGGRCLFQETSLVSAFFSSNLPSAPVNSSTNHLLCDLLHYVSTSLTQYVIFMELAFLGGGERKGRRGFIKIMRLSFALKCSKFPSYKLTVWRSSFQNWLGS